MTTNLKPNQRHLDNIENWLIEEWETQRKGSYTDLEMIREAFKEKRLNVITENGYAIGFIVYRIHDLIAEIKIIEIKPTERKKGFAKKLIKETLDFFKTESILAVKLFCSPPGSESFWRHIGFLNFPYFPHHHKTYMYKTLVKALKTSKKEYDGSTIKLWNCEPYRVKDKTPNWIWNLRFSDDKGSLIKPIIFPAYKDWQMELIKSNGEKFIGKVKYCEMVLDNQRMFMIIRKINV